MHVWNVLHTACWKCRMQKNRHFGTIAQFCLAKSSQIRHVSTIGKKLVKQQYLLQYGELRLTNSWDLLASLGHPCKFQRVSHRGSVTARYSSSGRQPYFAALNIGRHLYSAGRPSRLYWPTVLVFIYIVVGPCGPWVVWLGLFHFRAGCHTRWSNLDVFCVTECLGLLCISIFLY